MTTADFVKPIGQAFLLVIGGLFFVIGYVLGIIFVPFSEGADAGMDLADDIIIYLTDEEDE